MSNSARAKLDPAQLSLFFLMSYVKTPICISKNQLHQIQATRYSFYSVSYYLSNSGIKTFQMLLKQLPELEFFLGIFSLRKVNNEIISFLKLKCSKGFALLLHCDFHCVGLLNPTLSTLLNLHISLQTSPNVSD